MADAPLLNETGLFLEMKVGDPIYFPTFDTMCGKVRDFVDQNKNAKGASWHMPKYRVTQWTSRCQTVF